MMQPQTAVASQNVTEITGLFTRLQMVNAELEAITDICLEAEQKGVTSIISIEQQRKKAAEMPAHLMGGEIESQPIIVVQGMGHPPPNFQQMISQQAQQRSQYEVKRHDYQLNEIMVLKVMAVIAKELEAERAKIYESLKKLNVSIQIS